MLPEQGVQPAAVLRREEGDPLGIGEDILGQQGVHVDECRLQDAQA